MIRAFEMAIRGLASIRSGFGGLADSLEEN